jgi:hypothetical protein
MDEANLQRTALQKDIQQLKQASKGKATITRFTSLKMSSVYWLLAIYGEVWQCILRHIYLSIVCFFFDVQNEML